MWLPGNTCPDPAPPAPDRHPLRSPRLNPPARTSVRTVSTVRAWDALEPVWNRLLERAANPSIFQTWEWLRRWWDAYERYVGAESLCILVAERGGDVVGLAPLYRRRLPGWGAGRLRALHFIGDGTEDSDYLDLIIPAGEETEVAGALLEHLDREAWHVVDLNPVPDASLALVALRAGAQRHAYRTLSETLACTAIDLPGTWDEYLGRLQSRFRTRLRSLLRRGAAEHDAAFDRVGEETLTRELAELYRLHQERWNAAGEPGSFAVPERRAFYDAVARAFLDRGWLRFYRLRIDGRPAAYEFDFEYGGRLYYLQQGHALEFAQLGAGTLLKAHVLRDCIERGVAAYDFLGDDAPHKLTWGAQVRSCTRLRLARPGVRVAWALAVPAAAGSVRRRLRSWSPEFLVRWKRGAQRRLAGLRPAEPGG